MKPINQTPGDDNCLAAALASILELSVSMIPIFDGGDWGIQLDNWLSKMGLGFVLAAIEGGDFKPSGYHLIIGPSPRDDNIDHAVVGKDGQIVHDPAPDNRGLVKQEYYGLITCRDPSVWKDRQGAASIDECIGGI